MWVSNIVPKKSKLRTKLRLCNTCTHSRRRRNTSSNGFYEIVSIVGPTPLFNPVSMQKIFALDEKTHLLVSKNIGSDFAFFALNQLDVGFHTRLCKVLCEKIGNVRV